MIWVLVVVYLTGVVFFAGWFFGGIIEFDQEWSWGDIVTIVFWPLLIPMTLLRP